MLFIIHWLWFILFHGRKYVAPHKHSFLAYKVTNVMRERANYSYVILQVLQSECSDPNCNVIHVKHEVLQHYQLNTRHRDGAEYPDYDAAYKLYLGMAQPDPAIVRYTELCSTMQELGFDTTDSDRTHSLMLSLLRGGGK